MIMSLVNVTRTAYLQDVRELLARVQFQCRGREAASVFLFASVSVYMPACHKARVVYCLYESDIAVWACVRDCKACGNWRYGKCFFPKLVFLVHMRGHCLALNLCSYQQEKVREKDTYSFIYCKSFWKISGGGEDISLEMEHGATGILLKQILKDNSHKIICNPAGSYRGHYGMSSIAKLGKKLPGSANYSAATV